MAITAFFEDMGEVVDVILTILPRKLIYEPCPYHKAAAARSHLNLLISESKKEPARRTKSCIRSSWGTVLKFGKEYRLFDRFKGDEALRTELKSFLSL